MNQQMQEPQFLIDAARASFRLRDYATALRYQERAVAGLAAARDDDAVAHALRHLADMLVEAGRPGEAAKPLEMALNYYLTADGVDPLDATRAIRSAAVQAEAAGDVDTARHWWKQARDSYEAIDTRMRAMSGGRNPGMEEADAKLAELGPTD